MITKARVGLRAGGGDAAESTVEAIRALDRAAAKRILHRNNAARRKSRLARRLAKVGAAGATPSGAAAQPGGRADKGKKASSSASSSPAKKK